MPQFNFLNPKTKVYNLDLEKRIISDPFPNGTYFTLKIYGMADKSWYTVVKIKQAIRYREN